MRITNAVDYDEPRDTIAQDWAAYISCAFPESDFLFIPNIGSKAVDYIKKWGINILIISGGDDIGVTPLRDATETELLSYAIKAEIPTIGICRGLQLVHTYYGGELLNGTATFAEKHRATQHEIKIGNKTKMVNSYHTSRIDENSLYNEFKILARCIADNSIEAFEFRNILTMMWHPERDSSVSNWNKLLIEEFIKQNMSEKSG